ncbi:MAG TPA: prepilin peptidase [Candidatus Baltobacteraceae bacterium]|nr:prepilin peptidase [Candidatus Baltobacteraceae bacterium]
MEASASWLAWVVLVGCLIATITDLVARKIPNLLTIAILIVALAFHGLHGFVPFVQSFGAMAFVLILGTLAHARGWLGGGDVKLAAAVAAAFSLPDAVAFVLYTMVAGGLLAIVWIAMGRHRHFLSECTSYLLTLRAGVMPHVETAGTRKLPYALAIASGALIVYGSHSVMPYLHLRLFS